MNWIYENRIFRIFCTSGWTGHQYSISILSLYCEVIHKCFLIIHLFWQNNTPLGASPQGYGTAWAIGWLYYCGRSQFPLSSWLFRLPTPARTPPGKQPSEDRNQTMSCTTINIKIQIHDKSRALFVWGICREVDGNHVNWYLISSSYLCIVNVGIIIFFITKERYV